MSKRAREWYACDYCNAEIDGINRIKAYTDNSGYMNKTFDMCCDDCLNKHLDYIQNEIDKGNIEEKTVEEYKQKYIKLFWT